MRILIVGAGAVGGYFGARLVQAGRDVTFLVRSSRATQLRRDGLRIVSPHGDVVLAPTCVTAGNIPAPYDLVILGVKAYGLEAAMEDLAPAVGPDTMILPLLNGMRHMDRLTQRFGAAAVLGGVCVVVSETDDEGRIVQRGDLQQLTYGETDGSVTARLRALDEALRGAGFETRLSTDILQAMWEEWVMLASLGAATCLMRGPIGAIVAEPGGSDTVRRIVSDCAAIATACGHKPSDDFIARHNKAMTAAGSPLTSSMYRDLINGRPVEVDQILSDFLDRGAAHGIRPPVLQAAALHLMIYDSARRARASERAPA